jgi:type IV pilus secretin PilQ/predicted competence protein
MLMKVCLSTVRRIFSTNGVPGIVFFEAAIFAVLSACAPAAMVEDDTARARSQDSAQRRAEAQDQISQPVVKETALQEQAFKLQDLSVQEDMGQTTVRVKFSDAVNQYRHFSLAQPSRVVLDVFGPAKQLPQVDIFRSETHWLSVVRVSSGEGHLRLVMEIAAATVPPYVIEPEGGGLKLVLGPVNPQFTAKRDVQLVRNGRRADVSVAEVKAVPGEASPSADGAQLKSEKVYTGQKLSLDFKDADIKNVFRLLAEVSGLNIIVTDEVKQRVTIRLIDVPWDQAMDLLIDTNGLAKEQRDNVVRISTAGKLKADKDALSAAKRAQDSAEPLETAYFNVNYAKATDLVDKVLNKIKPILSPRGAIVPDERSNSIVVRDIKRGIDDAVAIISRLDIRTSQVLIESNLIETTPTFSRALGMDLKFTQGGTTFDSFNQASDPFASQALGVAISVIQNKFGGLRNLNATLTAAEQEGNIKIISRPSVVTLNNVESTIKSERIVRVQLPSSGSSTVVGTGQQQTVAVQDIPVGITLKVTPQVSSDGFVLMKIDVKSSTLGTRSSGAVIPDELNRQAIANVLVRDGETIVIGGILKDTKSTAESGIPWLKDIPVFGWLFKSMRWEKDFEELVVFITPRLIGSGSENLPTAEQLWRQNLKKTDGG